MLLRVECNSNEVVDCHPAIVAIGARAALLRDVVLYGDLTPINRILATTEGTLAAANLFWLEQLPTSISR